jgi:hypothetical protein
MEEEHVLFVGILIDILSCAIHTCDLEFVGRPTVVLKGIRYIFETQVEPPPRRLLTVDC